MHYIDVIREVLMDAIGILRLHNMQNASQTEK